MSDTDDAGLTELLQGPAISIAAEDRAFGSIVARARKRVRRRRLAFAGLVVVVATLVGSVVAISRRTPERVRIEGTHHLSASDVTFAVFRRPATSADALPAGVGPRSVLALDRAIGSRLAIRTAKERVYVFAQAPSCLDSGLPAPTSGCPSGNPIVGEQYCVALVRSGSSGTACMPASGFVDFGAEYGSSSGSALGAAVTYGIVPDFVARVTYRGRDVPIVNNAFEIDGADAVGSVTFSTPDGDKTPLSQPPTGRQSATVSTAPTARSTGP